MPPVAYHSWSSGDAVLIRCAAISPRDEPIPVPPHTVLVAFNDWKYGRFDVAGRMVTVESPRDRVPVFGAEPAWALETGGPGEAMALTVADGARRAIADEMGVPAAANLATVLATHPDPVVWAIAERMRGVTLRRTALPELEGDQLLHQLYGRILLTSFAGTPTGRRGDGRLDQRRLRRVMELIDADPAAELSVAELAATAALSPFHFLRSFRRATGLTPHQFVLARRMERARVELEAGAPVPVVARRHGFAETWYFRAVYRRHHGLPPGPVPPEAFPPRAARAEGQD
ncbi:helix-turn-helix domain-containing protein [Inquilinus sp.]|jgi:AraC family transcriptional regulator|uniref:AraC family transcriptional regulator n=1 Tax=Inquilinus sp. TaxID=1932117 RepID=UPI003783987F